MPGYGTKQLAYNVQNANSCVIFIEDTVVAFGQSTSYSFGFGTEGYYGVGSALPQEIQQLRAAPDISIDSMSLTAAGQEALAGSNNIAYILGNRKFDIHVADGITKQVKFTFVGCVCSTFAENIPANRPVTQTLSFLAMDVLGQDGTSILNTSSAFTVANALSAGGSAANLGLS